MSDQPKEIQCIDWRRCFAFLEILRAFRMSFRPMSLLLCFAAVAGTFGLAVLTDQIPDLGQTKVYSHSVYENLRFVGTSTLWGNWAMPWETPARASSGDFTGFVMAPVRVAASLVDLAWKYWVEAPYFALVNTVLALALWSLVGGAVCRMAAVRTAREETLPWRDAVCFAVRKWPSSATCLLMPFGVLVLLAILVGAPTGLALMIPYVGEIGVGLAFGLTLLVGVVLAFILVGGVASAGLQWPTLAAEGSDSFDAISRSVSYVTTRPWKYLFYTAFATAYGCLTFIFVKLMAFLTLRITHEAVSTFSWGSGEAQDKLCRLWAQPLLANPWPEAGYQVFGGEGTAMYFIAAWVWIVLGMAMAFLPSFFFTSQTIVYFLLRKSVDATDIEEVYMEESDEDELPIGGLEVEPAPAATAEPSKPAES